MSTDIQAVIAAIVVLVGFLVWQHKKNRGSSPVKPLSKKETRELGGNHLRR